MTVPSFQGFEAPQDELNAPTWERRMKAMSEPTVLGKWCKYGPYTSHHAALESASRRRKWVRARMREYALDAVVGEDNCLYLRMTRNMPGEIYARNTR